MLYILYIKWCVHGYGLQAIRRGSGSTGCVAQVISGSEDKLEVSF